MVFVILKYLQLKHIDLIILDKTMIFKKKLLKTHKPSINSCEYKSTILYRGRIGIKTLNKGRLEIIQFNAIKHFLKRFFKKKKGSI